MTEVSRALARMLAVRLPDIVLAHAFEGGHPDHDACAFAVHAAVASMDASTRPLIVEFPSYHLSPAGTMRTGCFESDRGPEGVVLVATAEERAVKTRALGCFRSQAATLQAFGVGEERFRVAPAYDFGALPPGRGLLYERFDWGLDAAGWTRLARKASESLGWEGRRA